MGKKGRGGGGGRDINGEGIGEMATSAPIKPQKLSLLGNNNGGIQ